jgi:acyl-CoA reductase-like NAD-dependent aldehyde dehydrogenase
MYIGGEWITAGEQMPVVLPWDGSEVGKVVRADEAAIGRAVEAARAGAAEMARLTNYERAELLRRVYDILKRDVEDFGRCICREAGKPIREARTEAERALQTVLMSAEEARRLQGEVVPMEAAPVGKGRMAMTVREPLGIIGAITPFNFPLNLAMHKIGPALAGGNAVIHKPATATPLSALRLARAFEEAGAPAGAYNVVTGDGSRIGNALVSHPDVAMITFTGSVPVGTSIRNRAGLKRVTLELGSNSAVVIEPGCDMDTAVARCVTGAFAYSGQVCISVQRIYVNEAIASEFVQRMAAATEKLRIGHPYEEATDIASLITPAEADRVMAWIDDAVQRGATKLTGGQRQGRATVTPAILKNVDRSADLHCGEVFGPVVAVNTYRSLDEAIDMVNDSPYGLQAGIFTRDLEHAFHAAHRMRVGGVLINDVPTYRADHMPYGGVKQSGTGREGPRYAVEEMTELKLICWKV